MRWSTLAHRVPVFVIVVLAMAVLRPAVGAADPPVPAPLAALREGRAAIICVQGEYAQEAYAAWARALPAGTLTRGCATPDAWLIAGPVPAHWRFDVPPGARIMGATGYDDGLRAHGMGVAQLKHELGHLLGLEDAYTIGPDGSVRCRSRWRGGHDWHLRASADLWDDATVMDGDQCGGQAGGPYPSDTAAVLDAARRR